MKIEPIKITIGKNDTTNISKKTIEVKSEEKKLESNSDDNFGPALPPTDSIVPNKTPEKKTKGGPVAESTPVSHIPKRNERKNNDGKHRKIEANLDIFQVEDTDHNDPFDNFGVKSISPKISKTIPAAVS